MPNMNGIRCGLTQCQNGRSEDGFVFASITWRNISVSSAWRCASSCLVMVVVMVVLIVNVVFAMLQVMGMVLGQNWRFRAVA